MRQAIVDGNNLTFAAHSVSGHLQNSRGRHTGTVLTVLDMINTAMKTFDPLDRVVVAWDSPECWRNEFYTEYKANRVEKRSRPDEKDWTGQKNWLRVVLAFYGVDQVEAKGLEADDIAGMWLNVNHHQTFFVSNDKDWLQLLRDGSHEIYRPCEKKGDNGGVCTIADLERLTECRTVNEFVSVKAIVGDSGDNVPGLGGVGAKTAVKFLRGQLSESSAAHKKITAWMSDENGYKRSLTLVQLGSTTVPRVVVREIPAQYSEQAIIEFLREADAVHKIRNIDKYLANFREMSKRHPSRREPALVSE